MSEQPGVPGPYRLLAIIELQNAILATGMTGDDVMKLVAERAPGITNVGAATIELADGDDMVCKAVGGVARTTLGTRSAAATSLTGRCVAERKLVRSDDRSAGAAPLLQGEYAIGAVAIQAASGLAITDEDLETVRLLASVVSIVLHKTRSFPRPPKDITKDGLTGLLNRRAFEERLGVELARCRRYGQSFSLALLDLDGFNVANDRFGEAAGDAALKDVATILSTHTRVMDAAFRLGGDEFSLLMPGTALDGAKTFTERCRQFIADAKICEGSVTARFGVVEAAASETITALTDRAAAALRDDRPPAH